MPTATVNFIIILLYRRSHMLIEEEAQRHSKWFCEAAQGSIHVAPLAAMNRLMKAR